MLHNELNPVLEICSSAMNVSWVIGNGEWANVPNTDGPIWSKASFGVKVQQAWEESSDFRADMLQAALRIDWCEEPLSTALSKLRDMFGLFEDVSTECVLRLAIWIESVFFGEDKPEEIRKIPDWSGRVPKLVEIGWKKNRRFPILKPWIWQS
jgi:hypothetical protein